MIKNRIHVLIKVVILILGLTSYLPAMAQKNEVEFRKEISDVRGAIVPEDPETNKEFKQSLNIKPTLNEVGSETEEAPNEVKNDYSKMSEDEIPILKEKKSETQSSQSSNLRIFLTAAFLAALGIGSFVFIRRNARPTSAAPMQIKVLTQHHLGPRRSLAIIRVAGESILIGVTDHNVSMIKSLSLLDEDLPEVNESHFSESLKKVGAAQAQRIDDEFSMQGIRDLVSKKLKNMRNLES